MSEVTPEYLTGLRVKCETATPGPWIEDGAAISAPEATVCMMIDFNQWGDQREPKNSDANAAFIAVAREALPRLIAEIGRIGREMGEAQAEIAAAKTHAEHIELALREPGRPKQAIGEMAAALVSRLAKALEKTEHGK
jgi:hypothetical protein